MLLYTLYSALGNLNDNNNVMLCSARLFISFFCFVLAFIVLSLMTFVNPFYVLLNVLKHFASVASVFLVHIVYKNHRNDLLGIRTK